MVATPLASRFSRKLTRECAPRGSRNSLGNRFTSFSASLYLSSFSSLFSLLLLLPVDATAANPPYAPSGSYLRVLLIFSYYRHGHVGTFHAHIRESDTYVHGVRSTSRFTGLVSFSSPALLSPQPPCPPAPRVLRAAPYPPLVHRPPRYISQVLQYVSTLLRWCEGTGGRGRRESLSGSLSRGSKDEAKRTHAFLPGG